MAGVGIWALDDVLSVAQAASGGAIAANVMRVDADGTTWVSSGGDEYPAVRTTVTARVGDTVTVEISGGVATIVGNITDPSASSADTEAAASGAAAALANAASAAAAATVAHELAQAAGESAVEARASAVEATAAASTASTAAQSALLGLSTVEDVVDVVEWLSAHSKATEDASVVADKRYYVRDEAQAMHRVENVLDPSTLGWCEAGPSVDTEAEDGKTYYELDAGTGALTPVADVPEGADPSALGWWEITATTDTSMAEGKDYYTVDSGTGVASPLDPSALGWWEMDDAVTQYLAAHLAMTDHGLNLKVDTVGGWMRIGTIEGSNEYGTYVLDEQGRSLARLGEHTRIGRDDKLHVDITDGAGESGTKHKLFSITNGANVTNGPVMYVEVDDETNESTVYMTNAVVVQDLRFGNWMWYERPNGNMSVGWTGSDS